MSEKDFPLDENGDVLRRMLKSGDNLNVPRNIDFVVVLPSESAADHLVNILKGWGVAAEVDFPGICPSLPWEVRAVRHMLPTHEGITAFESDLEREAAAVGGRNDGWGCMEVKSN